MKSFWKWSLIATLTASVGAFAFWFLQPPANYAWDLLISPPADDPLCGAGMSLHDCVVLRWKHGSRYYIAHGEIPVPVAKTLCDAGGSLPGEGDDGPWIAACARAYGAPDTVDICTNARVYALLSLVEYYPELAELPGPRGLPASFARPGGVRDQLLSKMRRAAMVRSCPDGPRSTSNSAK